MSEEKQPTIWCLHEDCTEERNPLNSKKELVSHIERHHNESESESDIKSDSDCNSEIELKSISEPILESETTSKKKKKKKKKKKNKSEQQVEMNIQIQEEPQEENIEIKQLINKKAKKLIRYIFNEIKDESHKYVLRWLKEQNTVKCYVLYVNNIIKSIALLSKMNYDPRKEHSMPYTLDYIYTLSEYRRKQYAHKLLLHIKKSNNITAFCLNEISGMLFMNAGYMLKDMGNDIPTFRYP